MSSTRDVVDELGMLRHVTEEKRLAALRVVREGRAPDDVPEAGLPDGDPVHLPALVREVFGLSTSEARRLIAHGGVKVDDRVVGDLDVPRSGLEGALLQVGKRQFVRLRGVS